MLRFNLNLIPAGRPSQERLENFPRTALPRHSRVYSVILFGSLGFHFRSARGAANRRFPEPPPLNCRHAKCSYCDGSLRYGWLETCFMCKQYTQSDCVHLRWLRCLIAATSSAASESRTGVAPSWLHDSPDHSADDVILAW